MTTEYIICVFGAGGVGKSCLTMQFVEGKFTTKYDPTIEDVYKKTLEVDEKQYSLEILDTAGSDEFSAMRDMYVKNGHGFVLVYSITSQATFNDLNGYYERIMTVKDVDIHGPPSIILVGNKSDLQSERVISRETGQELGRKWNCTFLETSAKDRANVTEIFYDLVRQISRKSQPRPSRLSIKKPEPPEPVVQIHQDHSTSQSSVRTEDKNNRCCVLL